MSHRRAVLAAFVAVLGLSSLLPLHAAPTPRDEPSRGWIIVYRNAAARDRGRGILEASQRPPRRTFRIIPGLAVRLTDAEARRFRTDPGVAYIEPDYPIHADGAASARRPTMRRDASTQVTPYGVTMVRATEVWPVTRGAGAVVADLDSGIDLLHPDHGVVLASQSFVVDETVQDGDGHGTHTSGTIAAADNAIGVVGVAPDAKLLVGKVLDNTGHGDDSGLIAGIQWAVQGGANVINMSLGGADYSQALVDACSQALAAGVLLVASAGNDNTNTPQYPASLPSVLSVSAVNAAGVKASFSNFGPSVSVCAPGVAVLSTVPVGTGKTASATWNGTRQDANPLSGAALGSVTAPTVYCGLGHPEDFPPEVAGCIAHIRRGDLTFYDKVANATAAGAMGVIISNNVTGNFSGALATDVPLVVVSVSQAEGDDLQAREGISATISDEVSDYEAEDGTSMSAPHVSGVAALLYSAIGPGRARPADIRKALEASATDLGDAGRDDIYGSGLVNAGAALTALYRLAPYGLEDAMAALRIAGGLAPASPLSVSRYDVTGDGRIGPEDALLITRKVAVLAAP